MEFDIQSLIFVKIVFLVSRRKFLLVLVSIMQKLFWIMFTWMFGDLPLAHTWVEPGILFHL